MKIAVIGWGSLIWCPGSLKILTPWHKDGPRLPIEFARISKDCRLTLVIYSGSNHQTTYWALSALDDLDSAIRNLREREGCKKEAVRHTRESREDVKKVKQWLAGKQDLDAAIWTGLPENWMEKRGKSFSADDAVDYLNGLKGRDEIAFERAKEYVRNAPPQIQTEVRRLLKDSSRDWSDNELSPVLFFGEP